MRSESGKDERPAETPGHGAVTSGAMTALTAALRSLRQHPGLALLFLLATLAQGALQGAMIWALRSVLLSLSGPRGAAGGVLLIGAVAVLGVWLLRSAGVFAA